MRCVRTPWALRAPSSLEPKKGMPTKSMTRGGGAGLTRNVGGGVAARSRAPPPAGHCGGGGGHNGAGWVLGGGGLPVGARASAPVIRQPHPGPWGEGEGDQEAHGR